jgi:formiminotetrahydrofolate cyclodeaminase
MPNQKPIRASTLESFREHVADAKDPIAGGVAVAAVCAGLGMALLALTLQVASRRKNFSGDRARFTKLLDAANKESARLLRYAEQDVAMYQRYRDSLKRKRGIDTALRRIIESPLAVASSAARGVDICADAVTLVPLSVVSDLGAAATLLAGGVWAILLTVDVNIRQLPAASKLRRNAGKKRRELERGATRQVERVLRKVARFIQGDGE